MHQRMVFFITAKNRLLMFAYYGLVLGPKDDPNDGNGVGRVVREIYKDGSPGPIYFIRYNHAFNEKEYILSVRSNVQGTKVLWKAVKEALANTLLIQQWAEEADRNDPLVSLHNDNYKAFN